MTRAIRAGGRGVWTGLLFVMAVSGSISSGSVFAAECGPLKQVASIDLVPAPSGVQMVPVSINGVPKKLLLATAGGISALSKTAIAELGLHALSTRRKLLDRAGYASN